MERLKVFTAFSGYDSQCMALDRLGIDYELVGWSEIDRFAIQAHNSVYPQWKDRNFGDICSIDWNRVPDFDFFTYSSPCQDFSNAGLQKGGEEGSGTRSSLLWECRRAILAKRPKYMMMENVKALVGKKFIKLFEKWKTELESYGYKNYAMALNAKDYGVPQNRERIFLISILGGGDFEFPGPVPLEKCMDDLLDDRVDEKYYLSERMLRKVTFGDKVGKAGIIERANVHTGGERSAVISPEGVCSSLAATDYKQPKQIIQVCNIEGNKKFSNPQIGRVYSPEGLAPTLSTMQGGRREPKIIDGYRIRKVTPREYFRLMGVDEESIDRIQNAGISNTQQYKLAGNSIVVDVMEAIFRNLFMDDKKVRKDTLF